LRQTDIAHFYTIAISGAQRMSGGLVFDVPTRSSWKYSVLRSTNMADWFTLTNFFGNDGNIHVRDARSLLTAFYRVIAN
jgi:hypothetical protein